MTEKDALAGINSRLDALHAELHNISIAIERIRTTADFSAKSLAETRDQLNSIDETQNDLRIAVGKLEVKNGVIATIVGALSGLFSSKFGG